MLRIAIAFLLGHCLVFACHELPTLWPSFAYGMVLLAAACVLRSWTVAALTLGALLAWRAGAGALALDLAPALEGEDLTVAGEVVSLPERLQSGVQFDLQLNPRTTGLPGVARLSWYDTEVIPQPGERWQLHVRLKRRHGFANPGGFDFEAALFREGVGATGYVRASDVNVRLAAAGSNARLLRARSRIAAAIARSAHGDAFTGVLQGLAVGVQDAMTAEQWRVFARTGTTHLMAISGFHIGMVAVVFAGVGGVLLVRLCPQHWGLTRYLGEAVGGITSAIGYSALAGLSVPTQRTLAMLCLYLIARTLRRPLEVTHALALALMLILLVDPFAPLAPGAWLSFLAVAAILSATVGRHGPARAVSEFGRAQWAVTIGLLPVLAVAFGSLSLVSPLANAIAIPVFTFVLVPLTLAGAAAACFSATLGGAMLQLPLWTLHALWRVLEVLSDWPLASWHTPAVEGWALGLFAIGAMTLLLPSIWPVRVGAAMLCLPALLNAPAAPTYGQVQLTMLDVGQGLAAVVRTENHTLVYDTGPIFRSGRDTGELVVLPYLWSQGIRRADVLMISHSDADHAGGLETFLREMPTARLMHGPSLPRRTGSLPCRHGQQWNWDGVRFAVMHPSSAEQWSDNDSSCVLLVETQHGGLLLTGDIEAPAERAMESLRRVDVVTVPHHGSRSSSSAEFVAATRPIYALASAGYRNRWGFPKPDIVERWERSGARVITTANSGAIELRLTARGLESVREYRKTHRRFWHWRDSSGAEPPAIRAHAPGS